MRQRNWVLGSLSTWMLMYGWVWNKPYTYTLPDGATSSGTATKQKAAGVCRLSSFPPESREDENETMTAIHCLFTRGAACGLIMLGCGGEGRQHKQKRKNTHTRMLESYATRELLLINTVRLHDMTHTPATANCILLRANTAQLSGRNRRFQLDDLDIAGQVDNLFLICMI